MAAKINIDFGKESPPDEQGQEEMDGLSGFAEGNETEEEMPGDEIGVEDESGEKPSLADVVPAANTEMEDRMEALEAQLANMKRSAETAPPPGETAAPGADSEWAAFEQDYPDIAGPIKKLIESFAKTSEGSVAALHARIFEESMDVARPDWRSLRDDPDFTRWIESNPEQQKAAQVPGVRAALAVLKAYDDSKQGGEASRQRQDRLKASEATPTRSGRAPSLSDTLEGWAAE